MEVVKKQSSIRCFEYRSKEGTWKTFRFYNSLIDYIRTTDDVLSFNDIVIVTLTCEEITYSFEEFFNKFKCDIMK